MLRHVLLLSLVSLSAACGSQQEHSSDVFGSDGAPLVKTSSRPDRYTSAIVKKDDLAGHANIEKYIGKSLASLPSEGEAQLFLTDFAKSNAFKKANRDGVNCWFTSMASLMPSFKKARYMGDKEFACHLKTSFTQTTTPKFGDVIRLHKANGEEVHGATYVGKDESGKVITFTKNGTAKDIGWTFMSLDSLTGSVYRETETVTFYTPKSEAKDPTAAGMPCFEEAEKSRFEDGQFEGAPAKGPLGDFFDM